MARSLLDHFIREIRRAQAKLRCVGRQIAPEDPTLPLPTFGEAVIGSTATDDPARPVKSVFIWRETPLGWLHLVNIEMSAGPNRQPTKTIASHRTFPPAALRQMLGVVEFPIEEASFQIKAANYRELESWRLAALQQLPIEQVFNPSPLN